MDESVEESFDQIDPCIFYTEAGSPIFIDHLDIGLCGDIKGETPDNDLAELLLEVNKENHVCHMCNKSFSSKSCLWLHLGNHSEDGKPLICEICNESFSQTADFDQHYAQHCVEYDCFTCCATFRNQSDLVEHQQIHADLITTGEGLGHNKTIHYHKPHCCHLCKKGFVLKSSLKRHLLTHGPQKPFQCDICQRGFTQKVSLMKHFLTHSDLPIVKPYKCKWCRRSFANEDILEQHCNVHTKQKPFACFVCSRRFSSKRNLKRHGIEHVPGERSICDICGKIFNTKLKLRLHFMLHTNERPYRCSICQRGFTYSSHLKRHVLWHINKRSHNM